MLYSLVIPVYKAEKTLPLLVPELIKSMNSITEQYEIVLVDDCSPDNSWATLCGLQRQYGQLRIIRLKKNCGQLAATTCGIHSAKGKAVVTMDDDLQFSPSEIPALINYYNQHNYKLVFGIAEKKINSKSLDYTRTVMRFLFRNIFLTRFRDVEYFSSFRIMNVRLAHKEKLKNLFMIWKLQPNEIGNFPVRHFPTKKQLTSYTFLKRVMHFSPYLMLALQKLSFVFAATFGAMAVCLFLQNAFATAIASAIIAFVFLISGLASFFYLRKTEKIKYSVQSSLP